MYVPPDRIHWEQMRPWIVGVSSVFVVLLLFTVILLRLNLRLVTVRKQLEHEIVERKLVEERIRESERTLNQALDAVSDGIWEWNLKSVRINLDSRSEAMFGLDSDKDYSSEQIFIYVDADDVPGIMANLQSHLDGLTDKYDQVFRVHRPDGSMRWVRGRGRIIERDADGHAIRIVGTNVDISARKEAEQKQQELENQLRQTYKMEAIGTMAGGIAHDFNNVLAIILGNVELAQFKLPSGSIIADHLEQAKTAVLRARDLVQQILVYSRQGIQALKPVNVALVVDETLKLLRATIPTTVELVVRNQAAKNLIIAADSTQLQQVLINFCNNAVQAMGGKGVLDVALGSVVLAEGELPAGKNLKPGSYIELAVRDSGCGMEPEVQERIFDPFFTTKGVGEGTGMGLSVVQGIVESHGGFITAESSPGQGSLFRAYFPSAESEEDAHQTISNDLPGGTEAILFVDDEVLLTDIGSMMLAECGYRVTVETSSQKAIERFKGNPDQFDLVITDQTMPEMDGVELVSELLKIRSDLPVILCTGFSTKVSEDEAKSMGIKAFCMKPLDMSQLLQTTRTVLDESAQKIKSSS